MIGRTPIEKAALRNVAAAAWLALPFVGVGPGPGCGAAYARLRDALRVLHNVRRGGRPLSPRSRFGDATRELLRETARRALAELTPLERAIVGKHLEDRP